MTILERVENLMQERGVSATTVMSEAGLVNSSFTHWRQGKGSPSMDSVIKMANYFGVTVEWLTKGKDYTVSVNSNDKEFLDNISALSSDNKQKLMDYIDSVSASKHQ